MTRARRLVIVPDDVLWELPFQTLRSAARLLSRRDGRESYAPSIATLNTATRDGRAGRAEGAVLALGNPAIAAAGGAPRTPVGPSRPAAARRTGSARSAARGSMPVTRHGPTWDPRPPSTCSSRRPDGPGAPSRHPRHLRRPQPDALARALARGASPDDDGLLEAWEILSLALHADLVVLSACESGRGRVAPGEGLIGLSWALAVAGARTTIVVSGRWTRPAPRR